MVRSLERNLLVGNGINIQFGGVDVYSNSAILYRVIENIKKGKYTALTENSLSIDEQLGLLEGMVEVINLIKAGKYRKQADGLFMHIELDRITRTYPDSSSITSVFMEDYFLAFEIFNNGFKTEDGEEKSEYNRKILFTLLSQMLIDGIYNDGKINDVYQNFYKGINTYLGKFSNIFTTNYDYNLENTLEDTANVYHLHGEFGKLAPEYNVRSMHYAAHKAECEKLISKKIPNMDHIYSDSIMSWSWLEKYGELIEPDAKSKEEFFKSIGGILEIVGLSPANDEHLFLLININPKIKSVVYYYRNDEDRIELPHHIEKPVTYKKVENLWASMK